MEENKNEIMTVDDTGIKAHLISVEDTYCSMVANTPEEKKALFNAMNNPEYHLSECINMHLFIKDVYCETVTIINDETGEISPAVRIVLIDKDGVGYQCTSRGVYSALKKCFSVYGMPTWDEPLEIEVKQMTKKKNRNILTFNVM